MKLCHSENIYTKKKKEEKLFKTTITIQWQNNTERKNVL